MMRRPRRSVPATVLALVLLGAAVVAAIVAIRSLLGLSPLVSGQAVTTFLADRTWNDPVTITAGVIAAVIGLLLLAAAVLPGPPTVLSLSGDADGAGQDHTDAGVSRRSLRSDLAATAAMADGVSRTRLRVRRRHVMTTVSTPAAATDGIPEQVRSLLSERLDEIHLARPLTVRVRASTERRR